MASGLDALVGAATEGMRKTQSAEEMQPEENTEPKPAPALRANPFPEVTDLFCRLPLPTLFYRLEAVHLGDLMRL